MTCCAYSCTQYGLHTQYLLLTHADDLLCLQLHTVWTPYTVPASNPCWFLAVPTTKSLWSVSFHTSKVFIWFTSVSTRQHSTTSHNTFHLLYVTAWKIMVLHTILTLPDVTVQWQHYSDNIQTTGFMCLAVTHTHTVPVQQTTHRTAISKHHSPSLPDSNNAWW